MKIAVYAGSGIGGTEKAAALYAAGLVGRGHSVDYLLEAGPRQEELEKAGVSVLGLPARPEAIAEYFQSSKPDVVHQHVPGYPTDNPLYPALRSLDAASRPRLIETNVFGKFEDPEGDELVDFRLFISMASGAQAYRRSGRVLNRSTIGNNTVVFYPVVEPSPETLTPRAEIRAAMGLQEDDVLAIRTGRPGPTKWKSWELDAFLSAHRCCPKLKLLLMEPPGDLWNFAERCPQADGIILRRASDDFQWVESLYRAADIMIHASNFGESFGYSVAEGMQAGLPLIVRTTPWGDSAQVELVEQGVTGYVCGGVPEMSRRLIDLAKDSAARLQMGEAGKFRIAKLASLEPELDVLEDVLHHVMDEGGGKRLQPGRQEAFIQFADTFSRREWNLSEATWHHPMDHLAARAYSGYRSARSMAGAFRKRMRRGK